MFVGRTRIAEDKMIGCRECEKLTSGDCGQHWRVATTVEQILETTRRASDFYGYADDVLTPQKFGALIAAARAERADAIAHGAEPKHICSCGTTMVCPDIGCDLHKLPEPSAVEPEPGPKVRKR